ncbi:MAG: hypothetical protein V4722_16380 [Bacteroidota bacterium]
MTLAEQIAVFLSESKDQLFLKKLVDCIRPPRRKKAVAEDKIQELTSLINLDENLRRRINTAITNSITRADLQYIFSESGMITGSGFFAELSQKITEKILPTLLPEKDLRLHVRKIFPKDWDYKWINQVSEPTWIGLFRSIRLDVSFDGPQQKQQLLHAAKVLSYRIAALGLDKRIVQKAAEIIQPLNAFTEQNKAWQWYTHAMEMGDTAMQIEYFQRLNNLIEKGLEQVKEIRHVKRAAGTSLQQTFITERICQQLERLRIIITIIDPQVDVSTYAYANYFKEVVESENTHKKLGSFLSSNFSYLAYQIAEHGGRTGEKYITNNLKEYWQFFRSAAVGGIIISIAALIKMELGHFNWAPFWASFLFGLNYAFAFVIIHLLKGSIATKQPALTASAIASALDNTNPKSPTLNNMALMVGKVFRSQLASLLGNLLIVFPLTVLFAYLVHRFTGEHLVNPAKAVHILEDTQPSVRNIWFAAIAAFLLFMSGIISGYFDNLVVFGKIPQRIRAHRRFTFIFGPRGTIKLANYIDNNMGALMGNIFLGFALGFIIFFGKIFALPLDIRHVTISTGFFGFTGFAQGFPYTNMQWLYYLSGLVCIAFTNLTVSFGLALYVAMKSRKVPTRQLIPLIKLTGLYFLKFPVDFFFPPKKERLPQELSQTK